MTVEKICKFILRQLWNEGNLSFGDMGVYIKKMHVELGSKADQTLLWNFLQGDDSD